MHSSVLWLRVLEPYVPLRNATKRKRLRIRYICRNHNMVHMMGVNSNQKIGQLKNIYKLLETKDKIVYASLSFIANYSKIIMCSSSCIIIQFDINNEMREVAVCQDIL